MARLRHEVYEARRGLGASSELLELLLCPVGLGSIKAIIGKTTTSEFG